VRTAAAIALVVFAALSAPAAAQAPPPAPAGDGISTLPPLDELKATRERPLFSSSRRPPPTVEAETAPPSEEPPAAEETGWEYELSGVVMGKDVNVAFLRHKGTNEIKRVKQGETVDSWTIEAIAARSVTVRGADSKTINMQLFVDNTPKGDVPPAEIDNSPIDSETSSPLRRNRPRPRALRQP
jgi:general secretion pathway protein N